MRFTPTILFESRLCTGCRACELACGFRWSHDMDPSRSAIRVTRDDRTGRIDAAFTDRCNVCENVPMPMCVAVCAPRALSLGRRPVEPVEARRG